MSNKHFDMEEDSQCQVPPIPFPANESERLRVLREAAILDTPSEDAYDCITRLCSRALQAPMCIITLVDSNRQWFKSSIGFAASECPRGIAFCTYMVMEDCERIMVVENAREDPRFCNNPLVLCAPNIRYYVGASILVNGVKIGTLCIVDDVVRKTPSSSKLATLIDFADILGEMITQRSLAQHDSRSNGVQMHQSVLHILREPLQHLKFEFESTQRFASQIESQLALPSPAPVGRKILEYGRKVECFRQGVEHIEKLLDNALRVMIRLQDETAAAASSSSDAGSNAVSAMFAPFDPVSWQESMGYLLLYLGLPRWLCDCRVINKNNTLESHPDLMLLAVAAILTHLAAISSWSIRSVTVYQSESDHALFADIVCGGGGGGIGSDYAIDGCEESESIISVHRMLSWANGSLQVVPSVGLHRIVLPCRHSQNNQVVDHNAHEHHIIRVPIVNKQNNQQGHPTHAQTKVENDERNDDPILAYNIKAQQAVNLSDVDNNNTADSIIVVIQNISTAEKETTEPVTAVCDADAYKPDLVRSSQRSVVTASISNAAVMARSLWILITGVGRTNVAKVNPLNSGVYEVLSVVTITPPTLATLFAIPTAP